MAENLSAVVGSIHPASNATAVLVNDEIWVLFTKEIDENSIGADGGNFFVTGPESETWSGPDMTLWDNQNMAESFLDSPALTGIVLGTFKFERINLADLNPFTGTDTAGNGALYRTKAIFKPGKQLTPATNYKVYLTGDETSADTLKEGVKPQSVFDTVLTGTGPASVRIYGSFSGSQSSDTINVRIATGGVKRVATFTWWYTSSPGTIYGPILTDGKVFLRDGVSAFFGDGTFVANDVYTALVKQVEPFLGTYVWEFTTGSGSIQTIPDTTSTSVIGSIVPVASLTPSTFVISSVTPADRATHLPITTNKVTLEFSKPVDTVSVTNEKVKVMAYPVDGDEEVMEPKEIYKNLTVDGSKIIIDF